MNGQVIDDGRLFIRGERIEAWRAKGESSPAGYEGAKHIELQDHDLFPGLLDLHNHPPYNVLPLWHAGRKFDGRGQWRNDSGYRREIRGPMNLLKAKQAKVHRAVARYVEVKALLGGATCLQGIQSSSRHYHGLTRNLEYGIAGSLAGINTRLNDLAPKDLPAFGEELQGGRPMFFHLAEGLDQDARAQMSLLQEGDLLRKNLVCIHCLGLSPEEHQRLDAAGSRVVWSPLSNLLLYGQTLDMRVLRQPFALACDWTPSGSRNLLMELKVAWLCDQAQAVGNRLGAERLVRAVSCDAAVVCQWDEQLGQLSPGKLADCLALRRLDADPYLGMIKATERDLSLVLIGGQAVYGDAALVEPLSRPDRREQLQVGGITKALVMPDNTGLASSRELLQREMANLQDRGEAPLGFAGAPDDDFRLRFDMDEDWEDEASSDPGDAPTTTLAFSQPPLNSVPLDPLTVIDDLSLLDRISRVSHVPSKLGLGQLRNFYSS